jgi:hypothetical protein
MIRRAVLVTAAAVALILAPGTAMADYNAPGFGSTVSDSTPTAGVPFTVHVTGAEPGETVTLTITRKPTSSSSPAPTSKPANDQGVADFAVTLTQDGTYSLVSTSAAGKVLSSQTVTVVDNGSVIVAGVGAAKGAAPRAASGAAPRAASGAAPGAASGAAPRAASGAAPAASSPQLSFTGFDGLGLAAGGGALVLVGAGAVVASRRRKSVQASD